ncbi:MAG TPA: 2-phosphosulfolactate phosphatase [Chthoniobacteraceae bacterium]|nr:2-phosphosulfolactate phosphatase [Chthoniobacteraceae bacterium]
MTIDVALSPAEIALLPARDLSNTLCVVFDVLRATSSMITALAHGAREIHPVRTIEEAHALKAELPDAILAGERHGDAIEGFDLGNSPLEYREAVGGRAIITTTTNGTMALCGCRAAADCFVGALLNLDALAHAIVARAPGSALLVCAGTFETFALEDALGAGLLIAQLVRSRVHVSLTDAALAVQSLADHTADFASLLRKTRNGRLLIEKGRAAEVEWCAQRSQYNVVGFMDSSVIRPLPQ